MSFIPLFKNNPPRRDDEMYYNSNGSKAQYVKRIIKGEIWYGVNPNPLNPSRTEQNVLAKPKTFLQKLWKKEGE